jgi:hypothetical protein
MEIMLYHPPSLIFLPCVYLQAGLMQLGFQLINDNRKKHVYFETRK